MKNLFLIFFLIASSHVMAKNFDVPSFSAPTQIEGGLYKKVSVFIHAFCTFDKRSICAIDDSESNKIIEGEISENGEVSFPSFSFHLKRPQGCNFLLANCTPHLNLNIFFTQFEMNNEFKSRVLNFEHTYSPFKPRGHTVLNAGHYSANKSKFTNVSKMHENIDYFTSEYLPRVEIIESEGGAIHYQLLD